MENNILSPAMLWRDFNASLPLKESTMGEETFDDVVYREMYFSGRETTEGRVRIYGVYAKSKLTGRKSNKGAILILPDMCDTIDYEVIKLYVSQGYSVLMLDYRGEWDGVENYTQYPKCVSYANYRNVKDCVDDVPFTAKETCWYEWVAVAKYGVSFLRNCLDIEKVGVLGIRNGANVGWILCGTDIRVDCFVPLFGCGWRAYKGVYKNCIEDITTDDSKLKFLAGIDAHAYVQYVKCPVFYMTSTNSPDFDFDRSVDTVTRLVGVERFTNYAPFLRDVLNKNCRRDVDLFFAKYLVGFKIVFPKEPNLICMVEDGVLSCDVEMEVGDLLRPKNITVFIAEDCLNPSLRDWKSLQPKKGVLENKKSFSYNLSTNCSFVTLFALIEYRSGVTVSSKIVCKKSSYLKPYVQKLLYDTRDKEGCFSVFDVKKEAVAGLFFEEEDSVNYSVAINGISGVSSKYPLVSYSLNNRNILMNQQSILMFDVYTKDFTNLKIVIMAEVNGQVLDYVVDLQLKGGQIWQNIHLKLNDFKNSSRISVKDFTKVVALRFESESACVFNNILVI